jgi:aminomethyltransferase
MVDFAGYSMPVRYPQGLIEEHNWVRNSCGIFDVSHMGQAIFEGQNLNEIFSKLTPSNFEKVKEGVCKYTVLTNENGGIIDDLIITKISNERFFIVWNASTKHGNLKHVLTHFPTVKCSVLNRALIAIQGCKVFDVLGKIFPQVHEIGYMRALEFIHEKYGHVFLTRTGYTGEAGFEVSVAPDLATQLWAELLANGTVRPIGLGARDSLRLEVGYPLYGNDINMETNPISAGLSWVMSKNHTGFIGENNIVGVEIQQRRVGVLLKDKGVLRAGYELFSGSQKIGTLTSGGYSPALEQSIGQAYLSNEFQIGDSISVNIRGKLLNAIVHELSFVQTNPK